MPTPSSRAAQKPLRLGIVIVSYNVGDLLSACLRSVFAELARTPDLEARVVVVDNASADGSAERVEADFPQVELIANAQNAGFARGNNQAMRALGLGSKLTPDRPDAVFLLNPDTELQPGALAELTRFLAENPQVGACGARLNYGDGAFQHGAFRFPGLVQLILDLYPLPPRLLNSRLNGRYPLAHYNAGQPFAIDFALGAALMVRAETIAAVGLLDEGYFMYVEEMDWQQRMHRAGWPIFCVPAARVTHHEGRSSRQFRSAMTVALWRSRLRYYRRYYPIWKRLAARLLLRVSMRQALRQGAKAHTSGAITAAEYQARRDAYLHVLAELKTG